MRKLLFLALILAASAARADIEADRAETVNRASVALQNGQPQAALDLVQPVIATYEIELRRETRTVFCGMSRAETLAYMAGAASTKRAAVAWAPTFCDALYVQGFALVDLGKLDDARAIYRRLLSLAPMHAHFMTELGQTYRMTREWSAMYATCEQALAFAGLAGEESTKRERGTAWRCMGYALIEQGKYDEAEALYRKCLALDPDDAKAKNELQYIQEQRGKRI